MELKFIHPALGRKKQEKTSQDEIAAVDGKFPIFHRHRAKTVFLFFHSQQISRWINALNIYNENFIFHQNLLIVADVAYSERTCARVQRESDDNFYTMKFLCAIIALAHCTFNIWLFILYSRKLNCIFALSKCTMCECLMIDDDRIVNN